MFKNLSILFAAALVIALPFLFRQESDQTNWNPGDPELVVISSHNEAIRWEFGKGFSDWHEEHHGSPVRVDWRVIGGTSETIRYLQSEMMSSYRGWWSGEGKDWPGDGAKVIYDYKTEPSRNSDLFKTLRSTDTPDAFGIKIDVFFGGGEYDHAKVAKQGITVKPWDTAPASITDAYPTGLSGESWRTDTLFGNALSTFGLCYNLDRLADLGIEQPPQTWKDLADPRYYRLLGTADPTKSGSITKAFEMIIHQQVYDRVIASGFSDAVIQSVEADGKDAPEGYQEAIATGWLDGIQLVQRIGANARYFTDSSSKVPIDVGAGDAAVGMCIDFYGRFQSEFEKGQDGTQRLRYLTPAGGSSVSADPISLLRGAPNRELGVLFLEYVLGSEGQKMWCYKPGTPGGPQKFALRRLPVRQEFYTPGSEHAAHTSEDLTQDDINPYKMAESFEYRRNWTGRLFGLHRTLIRAMCLDSGDELRSTWGKIIKHGGPDAQPEAMKLLMRLPEGLDWNTAHDLDPENDLPDAQREWTTFFRKSYGEAAAAVEKK